MEQGGGEPKQHPVVPPEGGGEQAAASSSSADDDVVVQFKRVARRGDDTGGGARRRPKALRRKMTSTVPSASGAVAAAMGEENEEDDEDDDEPLSVMLRETRKLQRERERVKGTEAAATSSTVLQQIATTSTVRPVADDDDDREKLLLASTFTVQAEQSVVNPLLENYIEDRLREFREKRAKEAIEKAKAERGADWRGYADNEQQEKGFDLREEERRLYETPDHLKVSQTSRSDDQVSEAWLTGIQEIELPIEYKLKNIEATEEARQYMLKRKQEPKAPPQPDTYNTRFSRPSTTTQIVRRERDERNDDRNKNGDGQWRDDQKIKKSEQATDDITFERFKKRFRR